MNKVGKTKKVAKGIVTALSCAVISSTFIGVSVMAGSICTTYSGSFSSAWERYSSSDSGKANLTYGYNTWAINEDYAWAKHSTKSHYAALSNGNGWHTGSGKSAGSTSRVDVTHSGSAVSYYCYY